MFSFTNELPKAYNASDIEPSILKLWEDSGTCNPDNLSGGESYSIVLPPPNVTGTLHLGHAVVIAIEDILIRYQRMRGKKTLWVPGTDHAAIATQTRVEKNLIEEGMKNPRAELGRERFIKKVEAFAAQSHDTIVGQAKSMGASLDWSREAYTLDAVRSRAVYLVFQQMFNSGLIYRGLRTVNWCPRCKSTLADDEVEYREQKTKFYYFKYGPVVIGTARPETKFLDKTIIVHPDDPRYKEFHGKNFPVEWIGGTIEANVIADPIVDPTFGTGAMTITPAHSHDDFLLAQKYNLPVEQIIDESGNFTGAAGAFSGRNARKSREEIVEILRNKGLLDHIDENYVHNLSICYRCDTPVEPLTKLQWFINVNAAFPFRQSERHPIVGLTDGEHVTLKQLMRHVVESGQIKIVPERFVDTYYQWIDNLRDWNISRQIWFGHRIPVWYDAKEHNHSVVAESENEAQRLLASKNVEQDPDTLDTWFSAGLWTWSSLLSNDPKLLTAKDLTIREWAAKSSDLTTFHPTSVLETGYDIIFFWVARMILMTTFAVGEIPFHTVYLHGLVRDEKGRKMSKSLNNVIDPLDMIKQFGTDALRLALIVGATPGNDTKLSAAKIAGFRNFANKVWNVSRYVFLSATGETPSDHEDTLADRWIKSRLSAIIKEVTRHIEQYQFSLAAERAYDFLWHEFADWYVEINKFQPNPTLTRRGLETLLTLLHPFMPFVTEAVWQKLHPNDLLMSAAWPVVNAEDHDEDAEKQFAQLQDIVTQLRNFRSTRHIPYTITFSLYTEALPPPEERQIIERFCRISLTKEKPAGEAIVLKNAVYTFHVFERDLV